VSDINQFSPAAFASCGASILLRCNSTARGELPTRLSDPATPGLHWKLVARAAV